MDCRRFRILSPLIGSGVIGLDDGWQNTPARVAGNDVVKLVLNGVLGKQPVLRYATWGRTASITA